MAKKRDNRLKVLSALPGSIQEIRASTGLGLVTVWRWINDLVASEEAHLYRFTVHPHGGPLIAIYKAGPAPAGHKPKKPRLTTDLERVHRYRKKARRPGGIWEDTLAKARAAYWLKKQPRRDPLTAALFGNTTHKAS
jgi:hypothetical protein